MTKAQKIVDALIESDDDKKTKSMPDWLKKIKGVKDEDDGGEAGDSKGDDKDKAPSEKKSGSDAKSSGDSVKHTW
jgi:hypothetical protein